MPFLEELVAVAGEASFEIRASAVGPAAAGCWNTLGARFGDHPSLKSIFPSVFQMGICDIQSEASTVLFAALSCAPDLALGCLFSVSGNLKKGVMHKTSS